ncbi:MAG: site-specific integrase [Prevotellaceae bacterium]|nr:site-specific integrase [Candidatus Faecinaster equi]
MRASITLRTQNLKDGRKSFFIDMYVDGKRTRESIGLYLIPGKSREIKDANTETEFKANEIFKLKKKKFDNNLLGIEEPISLNELKFFEYFKKCIGMYNGNTKKTWKSALLHLKNYEKNKDITMNRITTEWIVGFREFLLSAKTNKVSYIDRKKKIEGERKVICPATASHVFKKLIACINHAIKENIISRDPTQGIERLPSPESTREYLTVEEIKKMITNRIDESVNYRACVFDSLTGYRWGDIKSLKWSEISMEDGRAKVTKILQKKKNIHYQYLNKEAFELIKDFQKNDDSLVFDGLLNCGGINRYLKKWTEKAGIKKHITFHCLRHTYGTLLVNSGVDIYTVSNLMGHKRVETTQIYAKIVDESRKKAVDALPTLNSENK